MTDTTWFPCELHCHTVHSDGDFSVESLMRAARERLLCGINLTDHNTTSGWDETARYPAPVVLCGIEWTTYFGHMLVLDCPQYVDWRDALPDTIDEKMREIHALEGLVGVAHPFQLGTPICTGGHWEYHVKDWSLVNYLEIWSEGSPFLNTSNRRAIKLWESLLDQGYHITPTFGRDWHRTAGNVLVSACTYLGCPSGALTPKKMKTAITQGKTVVSVGPLFYFETAQGKTVGDTLATDDQAWTFTIDTARVEQMATENTFIPQEIRVISNGGVAVLRLPVSEMQRTVTVPLQPARWYRAELWGETDGRENCQLAVTAPIYTKP